MAEDLRPITLGEILDRTFYLYRRNFALLVGAALLPSAVVVGSFAARYLAGGVVSGTGRGSAGKAGLLLLIQIVLMALAITYAHVVLTSVAVDLHLGRTVRLRTALVRPLPRFARFFRLTILQGLIILGISFAASLIVFIPLGIFQNSIGSTQLIGLIVLLTILFASAFATWLAARIALSVAACWVEEKSAWASIKRAVALSKGSRGRIATVFVLFFAIDLVFLSLRLALVAIVIGMSGHAGRHLTGTPLIFSQVFASLYSLAIQTLLLPLTGIGFAVIYIDQRVRKEGFDIDWMMYEAGLHAPQTPPAQPLAPAASVPASMPLPEPATVKEP